MITRLIFLPLLLLSTQALGQSGLMPVGAAENWHQAAGPNGNWQTNGNPPVEWSATRNENIRWRAPLPEAGMSNVTIWNDRVFVTVHVPIKELKEKEGVTDIIGICLDANTGEKLWQVPLPGTSFISLAGGFTDGTVFAPITDGKNVWFFNRCGSMGCYDFSGKEVWFREWTPRFKHNNRQAEPYLVGDTILYVEVADKTAGAKIQKWTSPGKKSKGGLKIPEGIDPKQVWTYLHGIDKHTGKTLWREEVGTSVHNTPVVGLTNDGKPAISHSRGGGHGPLEKPYGLSLTSLAPGEEGKTIWSVALEKYDPSFASHWNPNYVFGFHRGDHLVFEAASGKMLHQHPLYQNANLWKFDPTKKAWSEHKKAKVVAGKSHPNTNQANIVKGDWHWFLSHHVHYLGRVHVETGAVEYLELPAQLMPSIESRQKDIKLWDKGHPSNLPRNAKGFAIGNKGHNGTGWGHISAASPTAVGKYLFLPVVTGTVYVIDTEAAPLSPKSIVAVNDLGPGGETWSLASMTYSRGRLYAHTMKEILCIESTELATKIESLEKQHAKLNETISQFAEHWESQHQTSYESTMEHHRAESIAAFRENKWFPLKTEEELSGITFFPPNAAYRIDCAFSAPENETEFAMPIYGVGESPIFKKNGILKFRVDDQDHNLSVYKRVLPPDSPFADANYHFIPFRDATNGDSTYGGGRYLEFDISKVKNGRIEVDFNTAHNPWCQYSDKFPCPIPPPENTLSIAIPAGEMKYKKQ